MSELKVISSFTQLLNSLDGNIVERLSAELETLQTEMINYAQGAGGYRAKGKLSLDLIFELEGDKMRVRPKIALTAPEQPEKMSVLFVTPNNKLSPENPTQHSLPFGTVSINSQSKERA